MDALLFKARYPQFTGDLEIERALGDALLLLKGYVMPADAADTIVALMAAHILSVPMGVTERDVISVKSGDGDQVDFDRNPVSGEWLAKSGYGQQLMVLLSIRSSIPRRYGVIPNGHAHAINFTWRSDFDGSLIGVDVDDKRYFK